MKYFLIILAVSGVIATIFMLFFRLDQIEAIIADQFPVDVITVDKLAEQLNSVDSLDYSLFDVRSTEEFSQSHIASAIRVDPAMKTEEFVKKHQNDISNKQLIFYCSVGYRSSAFIKQISTLATDNGAKSLVNLKGGIFRWYNNTHPVFNSNGETSDIHPYHAMWSYLLKKRSN